MTDYENLDINHIILNKNGKFMNYYASTEQGQILNLNATELENVNLIEKI